MKYTLLPILIVSTLALLSCEQNEIVNDTKDNSMRRVAQTGSITVYAVEIDGEEYILAKCPNGISITPKIKSPTK